MDSVTPPIPMGSELGGGARPPSAQPLLSVRNLKTYFFQDEGLVKATFDLDFLATHRAAWGFFRDRRPDLYGALAQPRPV